MNSWAVVGRIRDAHGIKGEIFVALKAKTADWLPSLTVLGLRRQLEEDFASWDVEAARPHKDGLIVRLKGIVDRNDAEAIRGSQVAVPQSYIEAQGNETVFMGQLLGLEVLDPEGRSLGKVVDVGSNGFQDLLVVANEKGRFDVPLVDDFINELDLDSRKIVMSLPEGLIEV
jgi:16S rRNA processing protein RimM